MTSSKTTRRMALTSLTAAPVLAAFSANAQTQAPVQPIIAHDISAAQRAVTLKAARIFTHSGIPATKPISPPLFLRTFSITHCRLGGHKVRPAPPLRRVTSAGPFPICVAMSGK
jgi:hypothetical protein